MAKKIFEYVGVDKTNIQMMDALSFVNSIVRSLGDGKTEFSVESDKDEVGATTLVLKTFPRGKPVPVVVDQIESAPEIAQTSNVAPVVLTEAASTEEVETNGDGLDTSEDH